MSDKKQIFSKESLDKVSSPEQLNEYIRVASPSVWLVLGTVVLLLAGICVWAIFGTIDTKERAVVEVRGGAASGYVSAASEYPVESGMKILVADTETTITAVSPYPVRIGEETDSYVYYLGGFNEGEFCRRFELAENPLPDGIYEAEIITDSINPIRFVIQ